jgi:hypothetical protein
MPVPALAELHRDGLGVRSPIDGLVSPGMAVAAPQPSRVGVECAPAQDPTLQWDGDEDL